MALIPDFEILSILLEFEAVPTVEVEAISSANPLVKPLAVILMAFPVLTELAATAKAFPVVVAAEIFTRVLATAPEEMRILSTAVVLKTRSCASLVPT